MAQQTRHNYGLCILVHGGAQIAARDLGLDLPKM
jgi:hypothetical protein